MLLEFDIEHRQKFFPEFLLNVEELVMANILLRSPYFVTVTTAGHLSAQMALR